ncbi:LysR family transcriptional regulator [Aeromonas sp. DNP9]|uniref:LysR family transcriptional regulator n=1 Tax=Aeromonas sp. DNP9 TaxID=1535548 RepID=UPI00084A3B13|nr:LysR family transcriptional regulator [Aeromonas sp. DNP9]OEC44795.1 LysR family transcriptional regulator [Aeromonas sp. DNP9]
MDVRTLRAFVAVFEERNITAAATRLFITQPTLSTTIKTLEDELGVTLFVRQARGVEGTEAAHRLYPRAKRLIADTDSLAREFRETSPCLELTVGIEADLGDGVVGTLVNGVLAHEEILLTLEEGCCGDVRLGCESLRCGDELFIPLLEEEFVLVLPPDHPLTGKGSLTPDTLADEPWVTCPRHDSHLRLIAILGNQAPLYPRRAGSLRLAATMVAAGAGIAWLPRSLCPPGCTVAELAASSFKRRVGLCYAPDALRSAAVTALLEQVRGMQLPA